MPLSMCETGRGPPALMKLLRPRDSAVDPAEHCHYRRNAKSGTLPPVLVEGSRVLEPDRDR